MKADFAQFHLDHINRRDALKKLGAAGAAAVAGSVAAATAVGAQGRPPASRPPSGGEPPAPPVDPPPVDPPTSGGRPPAGRPPVNPPPMPGGPGPMTGDFSDAMFDVEAVLAGAWDEPDYGRGDQRGTFHELTPARTAAALALLAGASQVKTYQLGEEMFNGFPAFPSDPPRLHDMFLYVFGYEAPAGFVEGGGIQSGTQPLGPNLVSGHEERFAENFTFQIATQIDGLNHIGVGDVFYGGHRGTEIATPVGTSALGNETMGPICTRGVIYDVIGLKVAQGMTQDFFVAPNGQPVLNDNYRISLDDMKACLARQGITKQIGAGEVPIMHTGWTHLAKDDPGRYLTQEPGIYLAESRYFIDQKCALVASDTWGVEVLDPAVTGGNAFPCHQELITKSGVRIGESFITDAAIADGVYEGVLCVTPENVPGATCGSSAPMFLGVPA